MNYYERYDEYGGNEYQLEIIQIDIILISQPRGSNNDFGRPSSFILSQQIVLK